ncbi:MAG: hypothetical protein J6X91_05485 [Bacteroidales bacterium]|nr:hypothetical protein [Bacteroidales bacterium]
MKILLPFLAVKVLPATVAFSKLHLLGVGKGEMHLLRDLHTVRVVFLLLDKRHTDS